MLGIILGVLLFALGLVNFTSLSGLVASFPTFFQSLQNVPFFWNQLLFILAGIFLWCDAARKTKLFNGMISIIAGIIALAAGAGGHLQGIGILVLPIPLAWNPLLSMILGALLVYDSLR